jgi:hypothetical protein
MAANSNFTRKPDSKLTEEEFRELDKCVFDILTGLIPAVNAWLDNVQEVKNYVQVPVYDDDKKEIFTYVIKKPMCSPLKLCPFCQTPRVVDFVGKIDEYLEDEGEDPVDGDA